MSENQHQTCPNCGSAEVRKVLYGYRPDITLDELAASDAVLGGCVIDEYSSPHQCIECGVGVWPHGMFHEGITLHIELTPPPRRLDGRVLGQSLWVEAVDDEVLFVPAQDYETVLLALLVEVAGDGEQFAGWLHYRGLRFTGEARGLLTRFTVDDYGVSAIDASGGTLTIPDGIDRLVLHLLRSVVETHGLHLGGISTWFDEVGIPYARVEA